MNSVNSIKDENTGKYDFSKLFIGENKKELLFNFFDDVKNNFTVENGNVSKIVQYSFNPAEIIMPNLYKGVFGLKNVSISEIKSRGSEFFRDTLEEEFEVSDIKADLKINVPKGNNPIYIKYVEDISSFRFKKHPLIIENPAYNKSNKVRLDSFGQPLYEIPQDAVLNIEGGKDILYLKAAFVKKDINSKNNRIFFPKLGRNLNDFIKSFNGKISSIVPLLNNKINIKLESGEF